MLKKMPITDIDQLDRLVEAASSVAIYGSKGPGKAAIDYLIESGCQDKISAIVQSYESNSYENEYRGIPICIASEFFKIPQNRDALIIVSVVRPKSQNEIFEVLEGCGVGSCSYLDGLDAALVLKVSSSDGKKQIPCLFVEDQLCELMKSADEVVIYGTKENGAALADYLNMAGYGAKIKANIEVAQEKPREAFKPVNPSECAGIESGNELVLEAVDSFAFVFKSSMPLDGIRSDRVWFCTDDLMDRIFIQLKNRGKKTVTKNVQFAVAGFIKCGTTSFFNALQNMESIFVPDCKESRCFMCKASAVNPREMMIRRFYQNVGEEQIPGCVEPTFAYFPKQVYDTFGKDLKVGFIMRNPVNATFSDFKMHNRYGNSFSQCNYAKYGKYCESMFDDYIAELPKEREPHFAYADILENFLRYYPMSQIHVLFFEELVQNPEREMNAFFDFLGLEERYDAQKGFPKENSGDFVWATEEGWKLGTKANMIFDEKLEYLSWRILDDPETTLARANEIENELFRIGDQCEAAEKIYNPKMTPEQRRRLEDFYRPGVRRLEKLLDKDLSKLWFE